jgi:hypothetical protein
VLLEREKEREREHKTADVEDNVGSFGFVYERLQLETAAAFVLSVCPRSGGQSLESLLLTALSRFSISAVSSCVIGMIFRIIVTCIRHNV